MGGQKATPRELSSVEPEPLSGVRRSEVGGVVLGVGVMVE